MPPIPDEFPIDPNNWRACIRGTGNELQAWTWSRDIAKAVVELLAVRHWVCSIKNSHCCVFRHHVDYCRIPSHTWLGNGVRSTRQWQKWNLSIVRSCTFYYSCTSLTNILYTGCSMQISYKSEEETTRFIKNNQQTEVTRALEVALVEEWMIAGASACPREKTLLQRKKYFPSVTFSNLEALLSQAEKEGFK